MRGGSNLALAEFIMPDELVCVATFDKVPEARLCKSQLEWAGIRATLENEHTINANWLWNNAFGGIRLYVFEADREKALAVLEQGRHVFHLDEKQSETDVKEFAGSDAGAGGGQGPEDDIDEFSLADEREARAKRALQFAIAGMFICPLQLFTLWIVYEVATMKGPLRPIYAFYSIGAAMIAVPYVLIAVAFAVALVFNL
jgi:hypothetical protein